MSTYDFWRARLADPSTPFPEEGLPLGYWRHKRVANESARQVPVAVFMDGERKVVRVGSTRGKFYDFDEKQIAEWEIEPWRLGEAVSYDDYLVAWQTGEWPDHAPARMGHNRPPDDIAEASDQIDSVSNLLRERLDKPEDTQEWADGVANLRDRLRSIQTALENQRKAARKPLNDELAEISRRYKEPLERAEKLRKLAGEAVAEFLKRERERKATEIAKATEAGKSPQEINEMMPRAGTGKRRTGIKRQKIAIVEDYEKALAFFANNSEVVELVHKLANRVARNGGEVPGCRIETKETAT